MINMLNGKWRSGRKSSLLNTILLVTSFAIVLVLSVLTDSQPAYALPLHTGNVRAIPAFARKYGLPCSACHTAWPELNNFGQTFRDNGYQLNNDHDSPIYQDPGYFPITFRITPQWHRESINNQSLDDPNNPGGTINGRSTQHGFDLSGFDMWATGTLYKNISFSIPPSADSSGAFHFENAFIRFDNLKGSRWLNLRLGKFELDNMISEKRFLFLSGNGGSYQSYHFVPTGESLNAFGLGDNQLGAELAGHSVNSYTRYSVAVLGSNDGNSGYNSNTPLPAGRSYDTYLTFSQAFQVGKLGLQRFGGYAYIGQRPTIALTQGGVAIPGAGYGNKPFYRVGFSGDWNFGKLEVLPFFLHGYESAFLGTNTAANQALPDGAMAPTWNSGFVETHLHLSPQFVFTNRVELIRMSRQALPDTPLNTGDIDAYSVGYRWYPIMFSRAGIAFHNEYSIVKTKGAGVGANPLVDPPTATWSNSLMAGFDFAF